MRSRELKRMLEGLGKLTPGQRQQVLGALIVSKTAGADVAAVIEARLSPAPLCPHCAGQHVVRNGQADGLRRYKCRGCSRTFNALCGTPLARLRQRGKWLAQAQVLAEGLSVHQAAARLQVAPSTAFRWRHRFLALPQSVKPQTLLGIAEADETFILRSSKGQRPAGRQSRRRGGKSSTRGTSDDHVPVLVVRDRSGTSTDLIPRRADRAQLAAVLAPVLAPDALLCTDGSSALAAAARQIGIEHHPLNMTSGTRVQGPWHIQNVNAYHGRLKEWMRRFHGVATSYLARYLGWFRAIDRLGRLRTPPASLLALAVGAPDHP